MRPGTAGQFRQSRRRSRRDPAGVPGHRLDRPQPDGGDAGDRRGRGGGGLRSERRDGGRCPGARSPARARRLAGRNARSRARRRRHRDAERPARRSSAIQAFECRRRRLLPKPLARTAAEARPSSMLRGAPTGCSASISPTASRRRCRRSASWCGGRARPGFRGRSRPSTMPTGPDAGWFWDPQLSGGGCLIDLGVHLVDLACGCSISPTSRPQPRPSCAMDGQSVPARSKTMRSPSSHLRMECRCGWPAHGT